MTKSTLFIVFLFLLLRISIGQSLPLELIGSSGAEQQNEISLQWTIGETMVFYNQEENTVSVSEGFHQLFSIDRDLKAEAEVRANVFPNPSFNLFTVEVDNPGAIDYTTVLADIAKNEPTTPISLEIPLRLRRDKKAQPSRSESVIPMPEIEAILKESIDFVRKAMA